MFFITGLDFTCAVNLFSHLQNRGRSLLIQCGRKIMKNIRFPFVLIVTCDRAEIIAEHEIPPEVLERALSVNPIAARKCRYSIKEDDVLCHVFLLSTGILSPLFGEDTIQGQLAESAECSRLVGSSSPALDKLLNMAVAFSKRMHSSYKLRVFDESIAEAVMKKLVGKRRVLVVGTGEAARMIAEKLLPEHDVVMTLRDTTKTFLVPPGVRAVDYESRMDEAIISDAVVSASSGLYHTFSEDDVRKLAGKIIFDLATPPDIPPSESVVRVKDLGVREEKKENVVSLVSSAAEKEICSYKEWQERSRTIPDMKVMAESVALETMRRLSGPIASLKLDDECEEALRCAILDSVRKSYIAKSFQK